MGKYTSVIIGAVIAFIGILGLIRWMGPLVLIIKGTVPVLMVFAGVIAIIAGLSEVKDEAAAKK